MRHVLLKCECVWGSMTESESRQAERDRRLFDAIAEEYCRKDRVPAARVARRQRLLRTLRQVPGGHHPRLLEAGCGAGFSAEYLAGRFVEYVGIDHSQKLIDYAIAQHGGPAIEFVAGSIEELSVTKSFDLVFMIGVLHHVENRVEVLRHLRGLLKPGGWLAANEPQPGNPLVRLARSVRTRIDRSYSRDQEQLTAGELRSAMVRAGYETVALRPQGVLSTPFAEVVLPAQRLLWPVVHLACLADNVLETTLCRLVPWSTWNLVCVGRRPADK